jgi:type IV pilus assembly protein PilW
MKLQNKYITLTLEKGLSIVELMVSLALGLMAVMAATALMVSSKAGYVTVDEVTRLQETARYAFENISRSVHQTTNADWNKEYVSIMTEDAHSANIFGLDASSLGSTTSNIQSPIQNSINGSDILAVRYLGSGDGEYGDGTVLNCAGFGVRAVNSSAEVEEGRGWSIFYVSKDATGEPELRCKYQGKNNGWTSAAIARGVESFQVLYGIDTDTDGLPNQFVTATAVNQLDELSQNGTNPKEAELQLRKKSHWKKVVAIKVSLLIRGSQKSRSDAMQNEYALFGSEYSYANSDDIGTLIKEDKMQPAVQNRQRKVFQQTIMLRNTQSGGKI